MTAGCRGSWKSVRRGWEVVEKSCKMPPLAGTGSGHAGAFMPMYHPFPGPDKLQRWEEMPSCDNADHSPGPGAGVNLKGRGGETGASTL